MSKKIRTIIYNIVLWLAFIFLFSFILATWNIFLIVLAALLVLGLALYSRNKQAL